MILEEANKIVKIWGKYLEHCSGKFNMLFLGGRGGKIPESLLPYPKSDIEKALNVMDKHYFDTGNKRGMELMRETSMLLELYDEDEECIRRAGKVFSDAKQRKNIALRLKDWQKTCTAEFELHERFHKQDDGM
jgi:hypothetical protein